MERKRRIILFLAAAVLTTTLFFGGHAPSRQDRGVAFFSCSSPPVVTVRAQGRVASPGVYYLPLGGTVADVIKLTLPSYDAGKLDKRLLERSLRSGDIVELTEKSPQGLAVRLTRMKAGEQVLLGITLYPDQMGSEDWNSLSGIGPKLAEKIVRDRQCYGDFRSIEAVGCVPGMGELKLNTIKKYFDRRQSIEK